MLNRLQEFFLPNIDNRNADARTPAGEAVASPAPAPLQLAQPAQAAQQAQPAPPVRLAPQDAPAAARALQPVAHRAEAGLRAQAAAGQAVVPARQLPAGGGNQGVPRPVAPVPQPAAAVRSPRARHAQGQPAAVPRLGLPAGPQGALAHQAAAPLPAAAPRAAGPGLMAAPLWAAGAPAAQPQVRVAGQQAVRPPAQPVDLPQLPAALGPHPVRRPDRDVIARQAANQILTLRDLRIGDEKDHELVFAPPIPAGTFQPIVPPVDQASAGLDGRAYIEYLVNDIRTEAGIGLILQEEVLDKTTISDSRIKNIVNRMRSIMAQQYANPHLRIEMELLIAQTLTFCHDRLELAIGEMEDTALLSHLSSGRIDEITLYNYGVAFFMLDEVREKVKQIISERLDGAEADQSSHDVMNAIYYLQDDLHLPTRLQEPIIPHAQHSIVNERLAVEFIGPYVKRRAAEKGGENVFRFISTWRPWVTYMDKHEPLSKKMTESFQHLMAKTEEKQAARVALNVGMGEQEYIEHLNWKAAVHTSTKAELANGLAKELLFNWRAEELALNGRLPPYFG